MTEVVYVGTQPSIHFYILCYLLPAYNLKQITLTISQETIEYTQEKLTKLRFNRNYVLWYNNVTKLLTSGKVEQYF